MSFIEQQELDSFVKQMRKILIEKSPYKVSWINKSVTKEYLLNEAMHQIHEYMIDHNPRRMIHIANYVMMIYSKSD